MPRSTNKNKGKEKAAWTSNSNDVVTVDWRGAEWMTPIRHQMMTSICWAITIIDIIEMLYSQATGKKIELSEQDLLDYCSTYPRYCKGFNLSKAFEHVKDHGIAYLEYYPYTGCGGARPPLHTRNFRPEQKFDQVVDYVVLGTEADIEKALKKHPVIGHAVLTDNLQRYESGLHFPSPFGKEYTDPETGQKKFECQASHCVILVGYGKVDGISYWIVKNSWGGNWGENGYVKLARCDDVQHFTGYYPLFKNE